MKYLVVESEYYKYTIPLSEVIFAHLDMQSIVSAAIREEISHFYNSNPYSIIGYVKQIPWQRLRGCTKVEQRKNLPSHEDDWNNGVKHYSYIVNEGGGKTISEVNSMTNEEYREAIEKAQKDLRSRIDRMIQEQWSNDNFTTES